MINANEIRGHSVIKVGNELFKVLTVDCHQGGGKAGSLVSTKLKNVANGRIAERKFASHDKVEVVESTKQKMEFMYLQGDEVWFMSPKDFEQLSFNKAQLGHVVHYLKEGMGVDVEFVEGKPIHIIPPELVAVKITSTGTPAKGETDSVYKSAVLENGQEILVPPFIKTGDTVHVRIETGEYVDRVKE